MISPGMDHTLYAYSPISARAPFRLPEGKHVAVCPVIYAEDWALDPPRGAHADPRFDDPYGAFRPDYRGHTWREYGLRVGIFRLFEVFDRIGLTATLAVNASAARRCPVIVEEALSRGWEIAGHGEVANQMITSAMPAEEIHSHIKGVLDTLQDATGDRPAGWIGQDFGESAETPHILAAEGIRWVADWPNDEQPYLMQTDPPLLSVPVLSELDDVQLFWHRRVPSPSYPGLLSEAHAVLDRDGATSARVMVLGIHAWLFGMPHRIRYLEEALSLIANHDTSWYTRVGDLADWSMQQLSQRAAS